jgi:hypothetical protein
VRNKPTKENLAFAIRLLELRLAEARLQACVCRTAIAELRAEQQRNAEVRTNP